MPAPVPSKVVLLHGRGNGRDSAGYLLPTPPAFERVAPDPPDWLDDEGRQEWARVVADLEPYALLKNSDRGVLVAYVEAWSRFAAAVREYREQGVTRINPDSGRTGKHAAVAVAENAAVQMQSSAVCSVCRRSPNAGYRSCRPTTVTTRSQGKPKTVGHTVTTAVACSTPSGDLRLRL
jgi:P27 family predicted phage terminase small subunit